jgi:hypothetical protein
MTWKRSWNRAFTLCHYTRYLFICIIAFVLYCSSVRATSHVGIDRTQTCTGTIKLFHLSLVPPMTRRRPRSSYTHTDGMSIPDPADMRLILNFVGTWSEHDPSWEVRTLPNIPTILPYQ